MSRNTTQRHERPPPRPPDDARPYLEVQSDGLHDGLLLLLEPGRPIRIGRNASCELVIPESADSVSREHASVELLADGRVELVDTDSCNGTLLDGRRVTRSFVKDGGRIQLGVDVKLRVLWLTEDEARLHEARLLDDLTGCWNRRSFKIAIHDRHVRAARTGEGLSMILLDVDHFKAFNTEHGFPCGDAVLVGVAGVLAEATDERVFRLGGEEFAVLLPDAPGERVLELAELLRKSVAEHVISWEGRELGVTVSVGCAGGFPTPEEAPTRLLGRADEGLRLAKSRGRNRVEEAAPVPEAEERGAASG